MNIFVFVEGCSELVSCMDRLKMTQEDSIIIDKISASEHSVYKQTMCMFQIKLHCLTPKMLCMSKARIMLEFCETELFYGSVFIFV